MVLFVPSFCHKALDDISKSNLHNLIRQKSKPSVDLAIRHWPRILVGGVALTTLYEYRESLKVFKEFGTLIPGLCALRPFESLFITGMALLALGMPCLLLGDSISGAVLLLRYDEKKNQLNHAQRLMTYWKFCNILILPEFAPLIHRHYPSIFNHLKSTSNHLFSEVIDVIISENPGYIGGLATLVITKCMFYWGLRTLIKDLKGEPRSWWGGKIDRNDLEVEKNMSSEQ